MAAMHAVKISDRDHRPLKVARLRGVTDDGE
jgi:hypothetical protein